MCIRDSYKARKASNKLYGVTSFVLILPLKTRTGAMQTRSFDFKKSLEGVSLAQIKRWEEETLTENLVTKRNNALKYA